MALPGLLPGFDRLAKAGRAVDGVRLSQLRRDLPEVAQQLEREIEAGDFAFEPLVPFSLHIGGKLRVLHRASAIDQVVLLALAKVLNARVEPRLSDHCHSYRKGRSAHTTQGRVLGFLQDHKVQTPQTTARGLYVIRTDVVAYGESIRVDPRSPLWKELTHTIPDPTLRDLITRAIRQPVQTARGTSPLASGIPTGSPIQPPLCNLYLRGLDEELAAVPGLFYSRFGDDLLLMHPSAQNVERAFQLLRQRMTEFGLSLGPDKTVRSFWNGAGRAPSEAAGELHFTGAPCIDYLGARLLFSGAVEPTPLKVRAFLAGLRVRLRALSRSLGPSLPLEERGRALCEMLRSALNPAHPLCDPHAGQYLGPTTDRASRLKMIRELELAVAEVISGRRGRRAFRTASPRLLREWGFPRLDIPRSWNKR